MGSAGAGGAMRIERDRRLAGVQASQNGSPSGGCGAWMTGRLDGARGGGRSATAGLDFNSSRRIRRVDGGGSRSDEIMSAG